MLNSIVARLLALADLGEDAANCSPWVRFCVLWSLCQADAVVREFVAGSTWNPAGRLWSPAVPMVRYGTEPADAYALAASLRALALVVQAMAAQIGRLALLHAEGSAGTPDRRIAALLLPPDRAAPAVTLFDTS
ncbi:MAG: hypothetical protein KF694_18190 [Mesorhizobium sp.]|nr:hypothetical protein [Mesorhizobium sp.]